MTRQVSIPRFMRSLKYLLAPAISLFSSPLAAQLNSLTTPVDARTVSLGESFAGVRGELCGMFYNPASLAGIEGASLLYSQRSMEWISYLEDFRYLSFQAALRTPVATFGAFYNRQEYGELNVTGPSGPGPIATVSPYDHTFGVVAAVTVLGGLDLGLGVKGFQYQHFPITLPTEAEPGTNSTSVAILVDIGALYTLSLTTGVLDHTISAGASLQNFGSNIRLDLVGTEAEMTISEQPARFLRTGVSYSVSVQPLQQGGLRPAALTVMGEYRNILNDAYYGKGERDYYGWGVEVQTFEILALRAGWFMSNVEWIYGEPGKPQIRYGAGVHIPLQRLGLDIPLALRGDYAVITLAVPAAFTGNETESSLKTFSIGIAYEGDLFQ